MLIATIREQTVAAARRRLAMLGAGVDQVEIRLDDLAGDDWHGLVAGAALPVIATCRSRRQGGGFDGSEEDRLELLRQALAAGAARIDVELGTPAEALLESLPASRLILSHHEFGPDGGDLDGVWERLARAPGAVALKLAYTPGRCSGCLAGREVLSRARREGRRLALVTMGECGVPGRILALAWGSAWAYAAADDAPEAAPGQLPRRLMHDLYDVTSIRESTVLTGLLGWPVASSLSPWMHNRAAAAAGLDARYVPFPERDAADFILNLPAWGLRGVSVTLPHKEAVLGWMDEVRPAARGCQAVNTITAAANGRLIGDNTDAGAARRAVSDAWPGPGDLRGARVAILGAGGAARAVAWALHESGARVTLHARRLERAASVARAVGVHAAPMDALEPGSVDLLVNATPVGMWPHVDACPVADEAVGGRLVFDLVSNPETTRLLRLARQRGSAVQGGLDMLVRQGEAQYLLWHGEEPPPGAFLAAAREGLRHTAPGGSPATSSGGPIIQA